jgi:hypothetical protein
VITKLVTCFARLRKPAGVYRGQMDVIKEKLTTTA